MTSNIHHMAGRARTLLRRQGHSHRCDVLAQRCFVVEVERDAAGAWELSAPPGALATRDRLDRPRVDSPARGDLITVWERSVGFIALTQAALPLDGLVVNMVAWPPPDRRIGSVPVYVLVEVDEPIAHRFLHDTSLPLGPSDRDLASGFTLPDDHTATRVLDTFSWRPDDGGLGMWRRVVPGTHDPGARGGTEAWL